MKSTSLKATSSKSRYQKWAVLFCAPNILFFIIFFIAPAIVGIYYSFTNYNGLKRMDFVGLENYIKLFKDEEFYFVLLNTFKYSIVSVTLGYCVSLGLALLMTAKAIKGNILLRVMIYWPTLLSTIMVGLTWRWIFGENFGIFNYILSELGLGTIGWATNSTAAFWTTIIASIWAGSGMNMLIFIGGITQIPDELHESAKIDGATKIQDFFYVVLPSLRPVSFMVIIMSVIGSFKVFAMVQTLTNGGPGRATTYMIQYIYSMGFEKMQVGYSSAVSMILFLILLVLSFAQTSLNSRANR